MQGSLHENRDQSGIPTLLLNKKNSADLVTIGKVAVKCISKDDKENLPGIIFQK